jgi:urea transport system ATP-binding protein
MSIWGADMEHCVRSTWRYRPLRPSDATTLEKTTLLKCILGLLPARTWRDCFGRCRYVALAALPTLAGRACLGATGPRHIFRADSHGKCFSGRSRPRPSQGRGHRGRGRFVSGSAPDLEQGWRRTQRGQPQQRARALLTKPKSLNFDAPTKGVRPAIVKVISEVIASLKGRISVALVEQYLDFAMAIAERFVVLSRGAIVDAGV